MIEFASATDQDGTAAPWESPKESSYKDLVLKPEFAARCFKFPTGTTWFRIVPALKGDRGWMLGIKALSYQGGRHAKTLKPGEKSAFDHAYQWCKTNCPESLYSKSNKLGYRLLADPVCVFWALFDENGKTVARLVLASAYDGSRGGAPGLGHQIWKLTQELDENGMLVAKPVDPVEGVQVCIEKTQPQGSRYPSYTMKVGRVPAPINEFIARMDPSEIAALTPLKDIIHLPSEAEEWSLLEKVIDPVTVAKIRAEQG